MERVVLLLEGLLDAFVGVDFLKPRQSENSDEILEITGKSGRFS